MSRFIRRQWLAAWLVVGLLGCLEGRAASQARIPLPAPGAEHPALFLRLMTRLCAELDRAAAAGEPSVPSEDLFKEGQLLLVERSEAKVRQAGDGSWMLAGPLAMGTRLSVAELQAESPSCSAGDNSRSASVRALHEYVRWATCELRTSAGAGCRLQVEEVAARMTRMTEDQPMGSLLRPRRSFRLTLVRSPKPQLPAPASPNNRPGP